MYICYISERGYCDKQPLPLYLNVFIPLGAKPSGTRCHSVSEEFEISF